MQVGICSLTLIVRVVLKNWVPWKVLNDTNRCCSFSPPRYLRHYLIHGHFILRFIIHFLPDARKNKTNENAELFNLRDAYKLSKKSFSSKQMIISLDKEY